ncbi:hypothetical protein RCO48_27595 [Peribacillus frigoritolerans]|nr:hypothetical protein [Peribacillus frigoritolerans]
MRKSVSRGDPQVQKRRIARGKRVPGGKGQIFKDLKKTVDKPDYRVCLQSEESFLALLYIIQFFVGSG